MGGIPEHFHYLPRTLNIPHFSMTSTQSLCPPKATLNASEDECEVIIPSSGQTYYGDAESDFDDDMPVSSLHLQPSQTKNRLTIKSKPPFPTTLPQFIPLSLDPLRIAPTGRANRNVLRDSARHTPFGIFSMFFFTRMLEILADHTNAYAKEKGVGEGRPWVNTSPSEIQCFMGICLYMGLFGCPRVEDYWNTNWHMPSFFFTSYMTLVRFQQIKRYLHIRDSHGDNGSTFFSNKIEPPFSHFVTISKELWVPSSYVSCDEMMVMNFGRSAETVRMKNKPIGSGFKIWALCDIGYIFHAFPSSNKYPWKHCSAYKGILPHCAAVVAQLVGSLPRSSHYGKSRLQKMYAVFMDNLFSTPKLFSILRDKDIAAVGTVRS